MIFYFVSFTAGAVGFFVYEIYRMYSLSGDRPLPFKQFKARVAHIVVYFAAGFLALFVNIDVVLTANSIATSLEHPTQGLLAGVIMRSFSLGILGPAGLRRAQKKVIDEDTGGQPSILVEDLSVNEGSFFDYIRYYLVR